MVIIKETGTPDIRKILEETLKGDTKSITLMINICGTGFGLDNSNTKLDLKTINNHETIETITKFYEINNKHPYGAFFMGLLYSTGRFIKSNRDRAFDMFLNSARQDNSYGQYGLGCTYYFVENKSTITPIDYKQAIRLFTLSADQNNSYGQASLGFLYSIGLEDIKPNPILSQKYLELSSKQNNQYGQWLLGQMYYEQELIPIDLNLVLKLLNYSAEQGNCDALNLLSTMYMHGYAVVPDYKLSHYYAELSAGYNHPVGLFQLGVCNEYGYGTVLNTVTAYKYYKLALNQNEKRAEIKIKKLMMFPEIQSIILDELITNQKNNQNIIDKMTHLFINL